MITKRHVLTAAHCTDYLVNNDYERDEFKVTLSDHDLTTDEDCSYGIVVKNIFAHPDYGQVCIDNCFGNISIFKRLYLQLFWENRFSLIEFAFSYNSF